MTGPSQLQCSLTSVSQSLTWTNTVHISSSMALKNVLYVLYWSHTNSWKVIKCFILHLFLSSKIINNSDFVLMIGQLAFLYFLLLIPGYPASILVWQSNIINNEMVLQYDKISYHGRTSLFFCYITVKKINLIQIWYLEFRIK